MRTSKCDGKLNHVKKIPHPEVLALIVSIATRSKEKKKKKEFMKCEAYMVSISVNYILIRF